MSTIEELKSVVKSVEASDKVKKLAIRLLDGIGDNLDIVGILQVCPTLGTSNPGRVAGLDSPQHKSKNEALVRSVARGWHGHEPAFVRPTRTTDSEFVASGIAFCPKIPKEVWEDWEAVQTALADSGVQLYSLDAGNRRCFALLAAMLAGATTLDLEIENLEINEQAVIPVKHTSEGMSESQRLLFAAAENGDQVGKVKASFLDALGAIVRVAALLEADGKNSKEIQDEVYKAWPSNVSSPAILIWLADGLIRRCDASIRIVDWLRLREKKQVLPADCPYPKLPGWSSLFHGKNASRWRTVLTACVPSLRQAENEKRRKAAKKADKQPELVTAAQPATALALFNTLYAELTAETKAPDDTPKDLLGGLVDVRPEIAEIVEKQDRLALSKLLGPTDPLFTYVRDNWDAVRGRVLEALPNWHVVPTSTAEQAPAEQAPAEQAPAEQAPAEQAPVSKRRRK